MQLIIVLGLIVKLASVSGDCDVGKTVHDFDFNKFTGTWYFLYHLGAEEDDILDCPIDNYGVNDGNSSMVTTYFYDKSNGKDEVYNGWVREWNNTGFSLKYDMISNWNDRTYILTVDYDRYFIGKNCPDGSDEVSIYVAFRRAHPDNATMEDVKKALRDNDIDFNQLKYWYSDRC